MYAEQRYVPRTPRTVSLGAAVAINGLILAGFVTMVPDFIVKSPPPAPIETYNVKAPPPPPIEQPKIEPRAQTPLPYVPPTTLPMPDQPVIETTKIMPSEQPPIGPVILPPGPTTVIETPTPLPPLVGAQQDPRFARDYQPEYPAQELRAQRDGSVSVRVLIGADGRVKAVEQVSATSTAFFEVTKRQALGKWRFKPATRGGVPQESWKVMSVRFEIKDL